MPLTSFVGSSHPLTKHKVEVGPSNNGGHKRSPPSPKGGHALTCSILVMKQVMSSPEFVTTSGLLGEPSSESWASSSPSIEVRHGTSRKCMFNSLDEVSTLSVIFVNSLTLAPQESSEEDLAGPSSLALVAGGLDAPPLNIPPL